MAEEARAAWAAAAWARAAWAEAAYEKYIGWVVEFIERS
jgi:hypothetical protein